MSDEIKFSSEYESFGGDLKLKAGAPNLGEIDNLPRVWINAAKEGQVIDVRGEICSMTREGLESSVGTWKDGKILDNHKTPRSGFKIYDDKFESPFLAFLLDVQTAKSLNDSGGGSIDAIATKVQDKKILKMAGVGYSILETGITPSCTKEAGCGIPIAGVTPLADVGTEWNFDKEDYTIDQLEVACALQNVTKPKDERTKEDFGLAYKTPDGKVVLGGVEAAMTALNEAPQDVNIPSKDRKSIYNILAAGYKLFDKEPPELKSAIAAEAGLKKKGGFVMGEKEEVEEVTFTSTQVADIKAAAVAEATETLTNAQKVAATDMETAHTAALKALGETHTAEMEAQKIEVQKQTALVDQLATKYAFSDEAKKGLTEAKTVEDVFTLFSTLKVEKAEPVIAAKGGKGTEGGGIVMGAVVEGKAPEVLKTEEVGTYDPYTGKYIPSFREEVMD
jgi:hypothetical protein